MALIHYQLLLNFIGKTRFFASSMNEEITETYIPNISNFTFVILYYRFLFDYKPNYYQTKLHLKHSRAPRTNFHIERSSSALTHLQTRFSRIIERPFSGNVNTPPQTKTTHPLRYFCPSMLVFITIFLFSKSNNAGKSFGRIRVKGSFVFPPMGWVLRANSSKTQQMDWECFHRLVIRLLLRCVRNVRVIQCENVRFALARERGIYKSWIRRIGIVCLNNAYEVCLCKCVCIGCCRKTGTFQTLGKNMQTAQKSY